MHALVGLLDRLHVAHKNNTKIRMIYSLLQNTHTHKQ